MSTTKQITAKTFDILDIMPMKSTSNVEAGIYDHLQNAGLALVLIIFISYWHEGLWQESVQHKRNTKYDDALASYLLRNRHIIASLIWSLYVYSVVGKS